MATTANLIKEGGDYFAGEPLLFNQPQSVVGLQHIIKPVIDYLNHPTEKLHKIMLLDCLYLSPVSIASSIQALDKSNTKLYVNNYELNSLPTAIKNYLDDNYTHFWASIYLYGPKVMPNAHKVYVKFSGDYLVVSNKSSLIRLDDKILAPNTIITLNKGLHTSESNDVYRLKLIPGNVNSLDARYYQDEWQMTLI